MKDDTKFIVEGLNILNEISLQGTINVINQIPRFIGKKLIRPISDYNKISNIEDLDKSLEGKTMKELITHTNKILSDQQTNSNQHEISKKLVQKLIQLHKDSNIQQYDNTSSLDLLNLLKQYRNIEDLDNGKLLLKYIGGASLVGYGGNKIINTVSDEIKDLKSKINNLNNSVDDIKNTASNIKNNAIDASKKYANDVSNLTSDIYKSAVDTTKKYYDKVFSQTTPPKPEGSPNLHNDIVDSF